MIKPKPGDIVYMDSEFYLSHGEDDIVGGKAEVKEVREEANYTWIVFTQFSDSLYSWAELAPKQSELRDKFGDTWAHARPDTRPEFNDAY